MNAKRDLNGGRRGSLYARERMTICTLTNGPFSGLGRAVERGTEDNGPAGRSLQQALSAASNETLGYILPFTQ